MSSINSTNINHSNQLSVRVEPIGAKSANQLNYQQIRYVYQNHITSHANQPYQQFEYVTNQMMMSQHQVPISTASISPIHPLPFNTPQIMNYNNYQNYHRQQQLDYQNNPFNSISESFPTINRTNQVTSLNALRNQSHIQNISRTPQIQANSQNNYNMNTNITSQNQASDGASITQTQLNRLPERQPLTPVSSNIPTISPQLTPQVRVVNKQIQKTIEKRLKSILNNESSTNEFIYQEIEVKLSLFTSNNLEFVFALIRSLFNSCYKYNRFKQGLFKQRIPILSLFVQNDVKREQNLLLALKELLSEKNLNQEFGLNLYKCLHEEQVVRLSVFSKVLSIDENSKLVSKINIAQFQTSQRLQLTTSNTNASTTPITSTIKLSDVQVTTSSKRKLEQDYEPQEKCAKQSKLSIHHSIENEEPETSCPICIDTIRELKKKKVKLMTAQCGHVLCKPCVETLFKSNIQNECPICRKSVIRTSFHEIYI